MGGAVNVAVSESNEAFTEAIKDRLISQNVQTGEAIDEYFHFITSQIRTKAFNVSLVKAAEGFIPSFSQYVSQRGNLNTAQQRQLENYYSSNFTQQYNVSNPEPLLNGGNALKGLRQRALAFQSDFIAGASYDLGEKDGLVDLGNYSPYAQLHNKYHPDMRHFLQQVMLKKVRFFSEFKKYRPSYVAVAGFASTPIYSKGKSIEVLIFQMPMDRINNVLTHHKLWSEKGFGDSG
jgi:methyl-accepting chemotaxis protein